jgi:anaerobic dimethyl sulfoxide reductase subunit C (anchor subunit)
MFVALVLSFLHLNNPINAIYAISNLKTSWLSREILFVSLFLFFLVLVNLILYFKNPNVTYYKTFILILTIVGIIMVYSMSRLYIIPTVPPWNSISTLVEFYSTVLLTGSAFVLGLYLHYKVKTNGQKLGDNKTKLLITISFAAIVIIVANDLFLNLAAPAENIAFQPQDVNRLSIVARWVTLLFGVISLIMLVYKKDKLRNRKLVFYVPFIIFLVSELIARAAFYASFYRVGL